ncbi:MAG: inositol monophosphatase [Saprospiraceae bacterium]|nr:inositol monophosphatase [Saprospiraceae bacterium]
METNLQELCEKSCKIVLKAGAFIASQVGEVAAAAIEEKDLNSLVSYVDKETEKLLIEGLSQLVPGAVFFTEEETVARQEGEWRWIIDPLDGTTNFLHQLPVFSVSVALQHQEETVIGIVYEVNRQECFYAWKNGGAWMNERPIQVSPTSTLSASLLATGFPYYNYDYMQAYLEVLQFFMKNTRGLRRLGSAAVDLAYVACGRFEGFYEYSLNAWDVAAGVLLVKEAGGKVTDFKGGEDYLFGGTLISSNHKLHQDLQEVIQQHFS